MRAATVEDTWPATSFWAKLPDAVLEAQVAKEEIAKFQMGSFTSKCLLICSDDEPGEIACKFEQLCTCFVAVCPPGAAHIANPELHMEVDDMTTFVAALFDDRAVEAERSQTVMSSFARTKLRESSEAYPKGRDHIFQAKARLAKMEKAHRVMA